MSELTAFFQDLVDENESSSMTVNLPNEENTEHVEPAAGEEGGGSGEAFNSEEAVKAAQGMTTTTLALPAPPARHRSTINDIMTTSTTETATKQSKEGGGAGGDDEAGEGKTLQRTSVYLLMHAMAAVDAANDEGHGDQATLDEDVERLARL